ncbi:MULTISPECIES: helicase C-terminal domain-containing protein [unclassified Halanaerobium]|uniref:helicase C-terminal domain-containing protein n=1 Tax=unclassified Halanaerobium TaxID=2641197 RepID=UPI000DF2A641|nr:MULTISPECIES: helicase C-terminal domain-containing protein [unclassified Halanaerobium]RCW51557.1 ATP-dependent DNA helicase DinG [Halanaerobium sp. MA284_MarDTE_T2]RCW89345.1 ATP-dependent DNA helicase DinG [Halanaerobium sp. DL-01]
MQASSELLINVKGKIKNEIDNASGNEIFIRAKLSEKKDIIEDFEVLARGNSYSAPAVINNLMAGEMIIHNHPSGDLTPSAADIRLASRMAQREVGFAIINNSADNIYVVVEAGTAKKINQLNEEEILSFFKKNSKLSDNLTNFSERKQQLQTAAEVIDSFNSSKYSFIEAGTGTGKSFAYLIPALFWNKINSTRVVVSTNTINLQEQLINKDLVLLNRVLPFSFNSVLVKGRGNYLCLRKFRNFKKDFKNKNENSVKDKLFVQLVDWKNTTKSGERSEIKFPLPSDIWMDIASESDLCLKSKCPYFSKCFFMNARKKVFTADILIVNHHLLLSDARLKQETGSVDRGILPNYNNLIIDEAHNIEEIATDHLSYSVYSAVIEKWLNRLSGEKNSLLSVIREDINLFAADQEKEKLRNMLDQKIIPLTQKVRDIYPQYFNFLSNLIKDKNMKIIVDEKIKKSEEWLEIVANGRKLSGFIKNIAGYLQLIYNKLYLNLEDNLDENEMKLTSVIDRSQDLVNRIDFNLNSDDSDYVFWIESGYFRGKSQLVQQSAPIEVGKFLPDLLWKKMNNIIFTSATLTVADSFDYIKNNTGINDCAELQVDSPFDYSKQAELIIPKKHPEPGKKNFLNTVKDNLSRLILKSRDSTLVLFTSYKMLDYCFQNLKEEFNENGIRILSQSELSRKFIIEEFSSSFNTVIFGTSSFWEGVDLPGSLLKYLIMVKLPFPVPGEPLYKAKEKRLREKGQNPFYNLSLPKAVIRFKQGFGRLIRTKNDKGLIILFDRRIINRKYGRVFLQSLPAGCPINELSIDEICKKIDRNGVKLDEG